MLRLRANALSSLKDFPVSLLTVLRHVLFGLPLPRRPCGFHSRAAWGISLVFFLRVCPIQPYFRLLISFLMLSWWQIRQSLSLLIVLGHQIFKICLRLLFMKDCSLCMMVHEVCQVSHPYSKVDLTHALNIFSFVCRVIILDFQTGLSLPNADHALRILLSTSVDVPPPLVIWLPRYSKLVTSSISVLLERNSALWKKWLKTWH